MRSLLFCCLLLEACNSGTDIANISKLQVNEDSGVSVFDLDTGYFDIIRVAVGLKTHLSSESPVLSFQMPERADYVEIIRCELGTVLSPGLVTVKVEDLDLLDLSEAEKTRVFRSNLYFRSAEDAGCELVTDGFAGSEFFDSFSPSGSFRYLLRACVSPERLEDQELATARNCSRRVGVSLPLKDFVNDRNQMERRANKLAAYYSARIDQTAIALKMKSAEAAAELDAWAEREHRRAVNLKVKEAWATITASVIEVAVELKTVKDSKQKQGINSYAKYYQPHRNPFDFFQMLQAGQGYMLANTFKKILTDSQDMPRSAVRYQQLVHEYSVLERSLAGYGLMLAHYRQLADLARQGQLVREGLETELPAIENLRIFDGALESG